MSSETQQILTTDGIPLEVSLKKSERKNKLKAFLLVAPLLLFLIITYVFPIGDMLVRSGIKKHDKEKGIYTLTDGRKFSVMGWPV